MVVAVGSFAATGPVVVAAAAVDAVDADALIFDY